MDPLLASHFLVVQVGPVDGWPFAGLVLVVELVKLELVEGSVVEPLVVGCWSSSVGSHHWPLELSPFGQHNHAMDQCIVQELGTVRDWVDHSQLDQGGNAETCVLELAPFDQIWDPWGPYLGCPDTGMHPCGASWNRACTGTQSLRTFRPIQGC